MSFPHRCPVNHKALKAFNRAAKPEDSFKPEHDVAMTIKGAQIETVTNLKEILSALYLDETDRQADGVYYYRKGTVEISFGPSKTQDNSWKMDIRVTRTPDPVLTGLTYNVPAGAGGPFTLTHGFVNHKNMRLDNQFINNPELHAFTLYSAMKEIRREKDPLWYYEHLRKYDAEHGTDYAEGFRKKLGAAFPAPH